MKILFYNMRRLPPLGVGGDTVSLGALLDFLSRNNFQCSALGNFNHPGYIKLKDNPIKRLKKNKIDYYFKISFSKSKLLLNHFMMKLDLFKQISYDINYNCTLFKGSFLRQELVNKIKDFKPELLITQLDDADFCIELGQKQHIPTILFIYDVEKGTRQMLKKINNWDYLFVIYTSKFIKKQLSKFIKCPSILIYQIFERDEYFIEENKKDKEYITLVNPVKEKGLEIIQQIIQLMPDRKFLLVEGWNNLVGKYTPFNNYPHVFLMSRQEDMKQVYKRTKILLIPSIWQEGFGRIAIEAQISGIPVIASDIGGLKESVGKGGYLIKNYTDSNQWVQKINKILNSKKLYRHLSTLAKKNAQKFCDKRNKKRILSVINHLHTKVHTKE